MAKINVTLDPALINNFKQSGDYIYIAAFNGSLSLATNGSPANFSGTTANGVNYYALINGGVNNSANLDLELTTGNSSLWPANYYIVTTHNGPLTASQFGANTTLSSLTNAKNGLYNFTMIEGDILGSSPDQLDVSAINFYGPNVTVSVPGMPAGYNSTTGFHDSFDTLQQDITNVGGPGAVQQYGSQAPYVYEIAGTPPSAAGNNWYGSNSGPGLTTGKLGSAFNSYLTDLSTNSSLLNGMMLSSNGNNYLALMRVKYDSTNSQFTLDPLFQNLPLQPGGAVTTQTPTVSQTWISQNATNVQAPFTVDNIISGLANPPGGTNPSAEAIQMFLGGTDTGMWGSRGTYINPNTTNTLINHTPEKTATVDLSQSWNWAQYYAYDNASATGQVNNGNTQFANVNVTSSLNGGKGYYDYYAGTILQSGTPYGWAYSDLLSNRGGLNPQVQFGLTQNEDFNLHVWDNSTKPTTSFIAPISGYVPPTGQSPGQVYAPSNTFELKNYLDWYNPNGGGQGTATYATPTQQKIVNENTLLLDFRWFAGTQQLAPDAGYPITLRIYDPLSGKAKSDGFVDVPLTHAGSPAASSPWKTYFLNSDFTTHSYDQILQGTSNYIYGLDPRTQANGTGYPTSNPFGLSPGQLVIENLPTTSAGTPGWYQLVIGDIQSPAHTVYDIYSTSDSVTGKTISLVNASAVANVYDVLNVGGRGGSTPPSQLDIGHSISLSDGTNNLMNTSNNGITWNPLALFADDSLFVGIQYQLILGRPAEKAGFWYWEDTLLAGKSRDYVTQQFVNVVAKDYPNLSNKQFVEGLYDHGFGRSGEPAGVNYWTKLIDDGLKTRAEVATAFTYSDEMWTPNAPKDVYTVGNDISPFAWELPG